MPKFDSVRAVRQKVEAVLSRFHDRPFAWPDDGCVAEPWYYYFHTGWVTAWNEANRQGDTLAFIRAWMTDEHITKVLAATRAAQVIYYESEGYGLQALQSALAQVIEKEQAVAAEFLRRVGWGP